MTASYDVVVVGGGAVGAACARELARAGYGVVVIEQGTDRGEAWRAAAGMLAPQIETGPDDPLLELGLAGRELYAELAGELRESTGIDIGFWQEGIARIAADETEVGELRSQVAWQRQQGHVCDWLDGSEVQERWPWLGKTAGALWAPREGALEPGALVQALIADARRHGATIVQDTAVRLDRRGDQVVGVIGAERYSAGEVVIAAGAWSGRLGGLPRPIPVEPVRGEMVALPWPAQVPPAIVYRGDCYLLHRGDELIAGSTMEYAGYDREVSSAGLARIFDAITAVYPPLAKLPVRRTWAGLRPVTPDGLPILGREPRVRGLWYATGHGRSGILLAGISAALIRQLLAGDGLDVDLAPFRPERFYEW